LCAMKAIIYSQLKVVGYYTRQSRERITGLIQITPDGV
jgi:hypothetical protein